MFRLLFGKTKSNELSEKIATEIIEKVSKSIIDKVPNLKPNAIEAAEIAAKAAKEVAEVAAKAANAAAEKTATATKRAAIIRAASATISTGIATTAAYYYFKPIEETSKTNEQTLRSNLDAIAFLQLENDKHQEIIQEADKIISNFDKNNHHQFRLFQQQKNDEYDRRLTKERILGPENGGNTL